MVKKEKRSFTWNSGAFFFEFVMFNQAMSEEIHRNSKYIFLSFVQLIPQMNEYLPVYPSIFYLNSCIFFIYVNDISCAVSVKIRL